ncbi:transmembrane protein 70, mitochondrial [Boleophthalmus pectinirostris]|uniref:transmembrane protein 70, mitochondrial n=1 Tax=Boleophthalmus pectinirostris TaxID=150288 RepID=UPI000A1C2C41|nr:transmembrane protein 70, mitochondrial [Boleophthalmus pectinirostris]
MLLSALSRPCALHGPLRALRVTVAGRGACVSAFSCGPEPLVRAAGRSLLRHESLRVPGRVLCPPSRWASSGPQSSDGQLIYTGSLGTAVRGVKAFSYSTSGASLLLMPHILVTTGLSAHSWAYQLLFCGVIGLFTFITPVLLHLVTRGYVVRLYHQPERDTYTAVTYSVFLTEKRTRFHQGQVRIPSVSKMFTTFYADKTGLLVNPDLFSVPQDYNHLMGYDKPFSFSPEQMDES